MHCAISGHVPADPVVSKTCGLLFERRLIEKEIQEHGVCPITKESLSLDDLLPVKVNKGVKPRPLSATSIPGMLDLFHNEWDALMLELHSLRQNLATSRQELSHSLYQHDAACRVIARLIRERDTARAALEDGVAREAGKRVAEGELGARSKKARVGISAEVGQELQAISGKLSKGRKKRVISESVATVEDISKYSLTSSHPLHKTNKGGILWIAVNPTHQEKVATAGVDGQVQVFDRNAGRIISSFQEHSKRVNSVAWISGVALASASADRTVRVWSGEGAAKVFKGIHEDSIVSVTTTASDKYLISASRDRSLAFCDVAQGVCLDKLVHDEVRSPYTCAQCHPDGLLVGTGDESGAVHVWEMKDQTIAKSLRAEEGGHSRPVKSLAFSENGYYMATAAEDVVKVWDLRKLKVVRELTPYEDASISTVTFDHSGLYLAVGGEDARIYGVKQDWSAVRSFPEVPKKGVYSLAFGPDAKSLFVGTSDHQLRVFGGAD
ncbi:hypothetical protein BSKO_12245 [Bryopsis sp. KO-2023]|nr:hypothetical protein BSKO_12245 [Bryopsis sp. KO-2023]